MRPPPPRGASGLLQVHCVITPDTAGRQHGKRKRDGPSQRRVRRQEARQDREYHDAQRDLQRARAARRRTVGAGALLGQRPARHARALVHIIRVARGRVDVGVPPAHRAAALPFLGRRRRLNGAAMESKHPFAGFRKKVRVVKPSRLSCPLRGKWRRRPPQAGAPRRRARGISPPRPLREIHRDIFATAVNK